MKCDICGKKTDWDESYGRETFIVCPTCYNKIAKIIKRSTNYDYYDMTALEIILEIGSIKEERKLFKNTKKGLDKEKTL